MSTAPPIHRRFAASTRAVAGIEFAMILPILLVLCLGFYDAGNAVAIYTKVRFTNATLCQLANQYTIIHDTDMQQILGASAAVLAPFSSTPLLPSISQISVNLLGISIVSWSNTLAVGSLVTIPSAIGLPLSNVLHCQVSYTFTPMFTKFVSGPITLSDSLYVSPRNGLLILRISP
jgi:Flp pilus assembly protein TadG